jgi:YbbR domain-containing protein
MTSNFWLKVFALLVAIVLFRFVNDERNATVVVLNVPIEISNLPPSQIVIAPKTLQARVTIKGPTTLVSGIASSPPNFRIKVTKNDSERRFVAVLRPEMLPLPPYVQVQRIEPSEVEITFDQIAKKVVKVNVEKVGNTSSDYSLVSLEVAPETISIEGPQSEVDGIIGLETYPIDLRDLISDFQREVAVKNPGQLTEILPSTVKVSGRVELLKIAHTFSKVAVEVRSALVGESLKVEPLVVDVTVEGAKKLVNQLTSEEILPFVRLKDTISNENTFLEMQVSVELPQGITVTKITPDTVKVKKNTDLKSKQTAKSSGKK